LKLPVHFKDLEENLLNLDGVGKNIELTATSRGEETTVGTLLLGDELGLLKSLEGEADVATSGIDVVLVLAAGTGDGSTTEHAAKSADTNAGVEVDTTEDSSKTDVVPVSILRGEGSVDTGLDDVTVHGSIELVALLEVSGKSSDELISGDILDSSHLGIVDKQRKTLRDFSKNIHLGDHVSNATKCGQTKADPA